jgi:hypothetical protein
MYDTRQLEPTRMTRDQFLKELRKFARKNAIELEINRKLGKGSHYRVRLGQRVTTLKSGELSPGYVRLIRKQLGIE